MEGHSYLTFLPANYYGSLNYVRIKFINSDTFSAFSTYLGMKGFEQNIEITKAAWTKGTIMHELCHAIGLYHEQCRADRDQYVNIDFSKMSADDRNQYKTYIERGENGADFGAFDFNSIMLYGSWLNGEVVMTKKLMDRLFMLTEVGLQTVICLLWQNYNRLLIILFTTH